ncbi:hypothetical protein FF38_13498 [Lucilia cuprina]|uniref:Uncharacterized protein n=1 Tax=Lucilia cuprina TaxID=7375 RepID=A0A0L0CCB0_LUCCU|nr:hypothetical protein FF38_13498 [Lucilia cuprina]
MTHPVSVGQYICELNVPAQSHNNFRAMWQPLHFLYSFFTAIRHSISSSRIVGERESHRKDTDRLHRY